MGDLLCLSQCCALYSAVGIMFTTWVGIMLTYQPFFVGGIDDVDTSKTSAFGAAGVFFFTFVLSIGYLLSDSYFSSGTSGTTRGNNPRSPGGRGEYDLVSLVQEYQHEDVEEEEYEMGQFS